MNSRLQAASVRGGLLINQLLSNAKTNTAAIKNTCILTQLTKPSHLLSPHRSRSIHFSTTTLSHSMESGSKESASHVPIPTAGIIIIGDEILKGRTQDSNSFFLIQRLHRLGVQVKKVSLIGDDLPSISNEVKEFSERYTHVITSGGIGPTHDDVTLQGIANAFNDSLVAHPTLVSFISGYFKTDDLSSPSMKMAYIPSRSVLIYGEDKETGYKCRFPMVCVHNVLVLPGVPKQLEKAMKLLDKRLFGDHRQLSCKDVYLRLDEVSIATALNKTVAAYPALTIGSYPELMHSYYKTHLTIEGSDIKQVEAAKQDFLKQIDPAYEVSDYVADTVVAAWARLQALLERAPALQQCVDEALQTMEQCLQQYKPEEICVCFNGGKDCLAVLHLFHAVIQKQRQEWSNANSTKSDEGSSKQQQGGTSEVTPSSLPKLQAVYITEDNAFPQMTEFVERTINRYELDCTILAGPLKQALYRLQQQKPNIKVVIMGSRRTDPYCDDLTFFQRTDNDWPVFMRVHPLINWQYSTVWDLIRGLYLPYCTLYDRGYTSLGNASNTVQNPLLLTTDRLGQPTYRPAYLLKDAKNERDGRI